MHRPCAQAILRGGEFEPETIEAIRRHAAMGDVVYAETCFGDMLPAASAPTRSSAPAKHRRDSPEFAAARANPAC